MEKVSDRVIRVIYRAMTSVNELLPSDSKLLLSMDERLSGHDAKIDSLGYINFITALEQEYEDEFGFSPLVAGIGIMKEEENPFRTVATLVDFLVNVCKKRIDPGD
jgi:acyl carrier protein